MFNNSYTLNNYRGNVTHTDEVTHTGNITHIH